jgi:D-serine deaminase-like pyridoxal phosphate-dependent protein
MTVAFDDAANAEAMAAAARDAGTEVGALVELDVGMGRCGVRSVEDAVELGRAIARQRGLRLRGLQGYEGHCMLEPDREAREAGARAAARRLVEAAEAFRRADLPVDVVSAGGTGTCDVTGAMAGITEIQAGSYALMDVFHAGLIGGFEPALRVLATVVSRQGSTIVVDVGRKTMGVDLAAARAFAHDLTVRGFAEEHTIFAAPPGCPLRPGDTVELVPGYVPTTVNLHDRLFVVDGDVVDVWPVVARGAGGAEDSER